MLSFPSSPLRPDPPVSSALADFTGSPLIPRAFAGREHPSCQRDLPCFGCQSVFDRRPAPRRGPPACPCPFLRRAHRPSRTVNALGISNPTVSLEHPSRALGGCALSALSVRSPLRLSKLLAPWSDRPRCSSASGRRVLLHPSLPPGRSPSPRVGYHYGADLGNCAGGSFPRKTDSVTGCAYRLHAPRCV